ncbi:MAG: hypothetical protein JKY42_10705, partial [Flavobacteriales bacterium]|nr:hypothetical protein [Flavobacteriales bacterium]
IQVGYRINYKTDAHFIWTLNSMFSDGLDSYDRPVSSKDKYGFIGVGINYTFMRKIEDLIDKNSEEYQDSDMGKVNDQRVARRKGLLRRKDKQNPREDSDEVKRLQLKLFETEMKLFENQYIENEKKK